MRIKFRGVWLLALLVIIVLVWGIKGLGYAVLGLFLLPLLAVLAFLLFLGVLAWVLRLRMQRRLAELRKAFIDAEAQAARDAAAHQRRAQAVDVTTVDAGARSQAEGRRDAPSDGPPSSTNQSR